MKTLFGLVLLILVGVITGFVGWHFGASGELGLINDRKAVQNIRLPRARFDHSITSGRVGKQKWKMVTLENKLECVVLDFATHWAWGSCNWEKWNAEEKEATSR